jgi:hypothetical protein
VTLPSDDPLPPYRRKYLDPVEEVEAKENSTPKFNARGPTPPDWKGN